MKADPKVIQDLQSSAGILASLAEQYRVDQKQLKAIELKWLKHRVHAWYHEAEEHLDKVLGRLVDFGSDPKYGVEPPRTGGDIMAILTRELAAAQYCFDQLCVFRRRAWDIRPDGVPDIYEHAIQAIEDQIFSQERQIALVNQLTPAGYVGARLEDS